MATSLSKLSRWIDYFSVVLAVYASITIVALGFEVITDWLLPLIIITTILSVGSFKITNQKNTKSFISPLIIPLLAGVLSLYLLSFINPSLKLEVERLFDFASSAMQPLTLMLLLSMTISFALVSLIWLLLVSLGKTNYLSSVHSKFILTVLIAFLLMYRFDGEMVTILGNSQAANVFFTLLFGSIPFAITKTLFFPSR